MAVILAIGGGFDNIRPGMFSPLRPRPLTPREKRLIALLLVAVGLAAWKYVPRPWRPSAKIETAHYVILSTATPAQTEDTARAVEALYAAYSNRFGALPAFSRQHPRLQMKLYKDRREFRSVNPGLGWAEAFYRKPYCQAYYSSQEINSHHWMLHEATHQLNAEVAHFTLMRWLEEGVAEYFSTSRFVRGQLVPGSIDPNTYPVWWIDDLATAPDLTTNLRNGSVIPLRAIVTGRGGPSMNRHFNLYYLHWWSLTHFLFETARHRPAVTALLEQGGGLETFEKRIGPVNTVQAEWHDYVRHLKAVLAGHDPHFLRTGTVPPMTSAPAQP